MADPVITDHFRVQAVFQHASGLPEDRFVNSFVFRNDTGPIDRQAFAETIVEPAITDFYHGVTETPGSGQRIGGFMPDHISVGTVRVYDLGEPPPRQPFVAPMQTALPFSSGAALPYEVASVLSLQTAHRGPRGRGRLYIGPLTVQAMAEEGTDVRVASGLRGAMRDAAERLLAASGITWVLLSQMDATTREITGGWIDDAPDTQRRRGTQPTTREPWGTYTVPV